jgi:hypothetical protein
MTAAPARSLVLVLVLGCANDSGQDDPSTTSEVSTGGDDASASEGNASATTSPSSTSAAGDGTDDAASTSSADDAESSDGSTTADAPEGVPVFVAQGHMGRTTISCDSGQTWIADHSLDDSVHCFDGIDCDHHVDSATGIVFGGGAFVATFGWGTEGTIQRSTNGVDWDVVLTGPTFAGTAFGGDVFLAGAPTPQRSIDFGVGWTELAPSPLDSYTPRGIGFVEGAFVLAGGGSGEGDIVVSPDAGDSWWNPDVLPAACGDGVRGIVGTGDTIVLARSGGVDAAEFCVSVDGGHVWTEVDIGDVSLESRLIRADDAFLVWSAGTRWSSTDGLRWTATPTEPSINTGAVAHDDEGHFVAVRGGWQVWYADQEFYRSADGVTWEVLAESAFVGSHPINHIAFGHIAADTSACP